VNYTGIALVMILRCEFGTQLFSIELELKMKPNGVL
jgi:hypothetical protein